MEKPTLLQFHAAMYAKYPGISSDQISDLYAKEYPDTKNPLSDPGTPSETKNKKKSKK